MPSILVVERDPNYAGRINAALSAEGWRVRVVPAVEMALQAGSAEKPDLILAGTDLPGFEVLVFSFSRTSGGPGVIGLVPENGMGGGPDGADGRLAKPFTDQQVVLAIRQALLSGRSAAPAPPPREQKLTSHDIFGDVLAEVEGDETPGFGAPAPRPAAHGPAPPPRPTAPGPAAAPIAPAPPPKPAPPRPAPPPRADDEMQRRLEKTLSGMLGPEPRPRPAAPPPAPAPAPPPPPKRAESTADNVDALLSKTLSNLEMDLGRTKTGVRPPAPAAPAAPPPRPATPAPMAPPPAQLQAAQPAPVQPVAPRPAPAASAPPREATGVGKAKVVGDFDFSELEDLIRPATVAPRPAAPPPPAPAPPMLEPPRAFAPEPQPLPFPPPVPASRPAPAAPVSVLSDAAATQRIPVFADADGDAPGERFGQYTLLDRIAVGGMAEVWKARMRGVEGFQKTVAIKKILPHMTDNAEFVGMFIDEAKLAAQLSHPNIVHIYDLGKIGRDYYIAMEYVEGKDLRSLLNAARRRGMGLPLGLALLIAARVASALDYAHRRRDDDNREIGLVHRDVSPQNVLLTLEGDVKLCDFGIAKAVSKASHTLVGALKGKLQYMSPEQAWGRPVDGRSDIFSLGAVLFEMITGERLFPGDSEMSVLESVRQGRTRTPRQIDPSVPAEVDEIVARAIAIDPEARFQTAGEMKQRLEAALAALKPSPGPTDLAAFIQRAVEPEPAEPFATPYVAAAPAAAPAPSSWPAAGAAEGSAPFAPFPAGPEQPVEAVAPLGEVAVEEVEGGRKSRTLLYAAIAALIVVAVLTFIFLNNRRKAPQQAPPAPEAAVPADPGPQALVPAVRTQPGDSSSLEFEPAGQDKAAELDMQAIVDEQLAAKEKELRRQLEQKQRELEQQVAAAKAAAQPPPATAQAVPEPAPFQPPLAAKPADPEPATPPPAASDPPPQQREPDPPPPQPERPREPEPQPEPTPRVRAGELVAPGPGVTPPQLVSFPKPEYPPMARTLRVEGIVVVAVLVDENGQVQDARVAEPIRQKVGLNEAAVAAARGARYKPATKEGVRVKMWTRLRIPFKL